MRDDLPPTRCKERVESQLFAYPCWLPEGHDGPHAAQEITKSMLDRAAWEDAQRTAPAIPTAPEAFSAQVKPSDLPPPSPPSLVAPMLQAEAIKTEAERTAAMASYLSNIMVGMDADKLPSFISFWITSTIAQTSLTALWKLAQVEFAKGAKGVVLTPEFLTKLIPQTLRDR